MTLDFWIGAGGGANEVSDKAGILINPDVWKGLLNSLKLSVVAALGAGTAGFLAGYAIVRRRGSKLSAVVENLTFIPYLIPSIAFGIVRNLYLISSHWLCEIYANGIQIWC